MNINVKFNELYEFINLTLWVHQTHFMSLLVEKGQAGYNNSL